MRVIIIGAGASGLMAAYHLANNSGHQIIVLEQNNKLGKKLLATGNGRCNITNRKLDYDLYNQRLDDVMKIDVEAYFNNQGMLTRSLGDLVYPYSLSSKTVLDLLVNQGVDYQLGTKVLKIVQVDKEYLLITNQGNYYCNYLVLANGSKASFLSGKDNEQLAADLNIRQSELVPQLTACYTKKVYRELRGIRVKCQVWLEKASRVLAKETGELLFTAYGVSGICIMQLSRYYQKGAELHIDLLPEIDDYSNFIQERIRSYGSCFYAGIFHGKLAEVIAKEGLMVKDIVFEIKNFGDFSNAQVARGGIVVEELDTKLQVRKYPRLFCCGETLDIDGPCGGYNLHFAFASAIWVANHIIEETRNVKNK